MLIAETPTLLQMYRAANAFEDLKKHSPNYDDLANYQAYETLARNAIKFDFISPTMRYKLLQMATLIISGSMGNRGAARLFSWQK